MDMSKKQLLMNKALELFARQGFEATSVQQITDYCGISKGAFYLSFKSKDELILALIDHFLMQITSDIDYLVRNTEGDQLLYDFYHAVFRSFHQHSDFTKVLMKEQSQTLNKELIIKMQYYDKLFQNSILSMLEQLYGADVERIKFDLMLCMKGFINTYSQLFLFYNLPFDFNQLAASLVEKTNLLAGHSTIPFITQELIPLFKQPISDMATAEQLFAMVQQIIDEIEDPIVMESLTLLKQQLIEPTFSTAIVKGLLGNIQSHPHCKWISYLMRKYFTL